MGIKIFEDLQREIIEQNLCSLCGGCLAVCTSSEINALYIQDNRPRYREGDLEQIKKCLECGICYLVCGQIPDLNAVLENQFVAKYPFGLYSTLTSMRTQDSRIREMAQDGGIVTTIIKYLLEKHLIDGAVVNSPKGEWDSVSRIITSPEELIETAGTRYSASPSLQALGDYKALGIDNPRLSFVGVPCQVQTVRKMQLLKIRPGIYVKYLIGLFCMENFDYQKLIKDKIENKLKIDLSNIKKMNIKGKFQITLKNDEMIEISLKDLAPLVRDNCNYCIDFTNIYADISVGGIGSPLGYSTVLIRTEVGRNLFSKLVFENEVEELNVDAAEVKKKILAQIVKLGQSKYDKGIQNKISMAKIAE